MKKIISVVLLLITMLCMFCLGSCSTSIAKADVTSQWSVIETGSISLRYGIDFTIGIVKDNKYNTEYVLFYLDGTGNFAVVPRNYGE